MENNELEILLRKKCIHCGHDIKENARYCPKCGKIQIEDTEKKDNKEIGKFLFITSIIVAFILSQYFFIECNIRIGSFTFDFVFLIIVALLVLYCRKDILNIIGFNKFRWGRLPRYLGIQILISAAVYLLCLLIQKLTQSEAQNSIEHFQQYSMPLLIATISTAVFPAITEELAFRGILFTQLLKLTSGTSTIIVTGIIFGLLHFSFLSFLWLIPVGFFFGWIRYKENTIIYGIFCHFLHNFLMVMIEYMVYTG
jgi:uncharacterized protein